MCALRSKNVPMCLTCSCANMPCMLTCSRANVLCMVTFLRAHVPFVLTYQCALHTYMLTCHVPCMLMCSCASACLCIHVLCMLSCSRTNMLVLMPLFSVSLPLLLKFYTLLVRLTSFITAFPQQCEFIYKPSLLILCRLENREYR